MHSISYQFFDGIIAQVFNNSSSAHVHVDIVIVVMKKKSLKSCSNVYCRVFVTSICLDKASAIDSAALQKKQCFQAVWDIAVY